MYKAKSLLVICCLLTMIAFAAVAQKVTGVYFGEIISAKNALVLTGSPESLTGYLYTSENEKIDLSGSFVNQHLKLVIHLNDSEEILLEGEPGTGSLKLNYSKNGSEQKIIFLNKISKNEKYKIADLFREHYDPMLFGRWDYVKETDKNGVTSSDAKIIVEYRGNGIETIHVISIPDRLGIKMLPGAQMAKTVDVNWSTDGAKLNSTVKTPRGDFSDFGYYSVKDDTLIIYGTKGGRSWYKRKGG